MTIDMQPWEALTYVLLGITLGVIGQLIRVVVGIKKLYDQAISENVDFYTLFMKDRFLFSIGIAVVIGAVAGGLGIIQYAGQGITRDIILTLIAGGYAGTDFIEGLLTKIRTKEDRQRQREL
jgi:H+/Cl- antiporter ClcA